MSLYLCYRSFGVGNRIEFLCVCLLVGVDSGHMDTIVNAVCVCLVVQRQQLQCSLVLGQILVSNCALLPPPPSKMRIKFFYYHTISIVIVVSYEVTESSALPYRMWGTRCGFSPL